MTSVPSQTAKVVFDLNSTPYQLLCGGPGAAVLLVFSDDDWENLMYIRNGVPNTANLSNDAPEDERESPNDHTVAVD